MARRRSRCLLFVSVLLVLLAAACMNRIRGLQSRHGLWKIQVIGSRTFDFTADMDQCFPTTKLAELEECRYAKLVLPRAPFALRARPFFECFRDGLCEAATQFKYHARANVLWECTHCCDKDEACMYLLTIETHHLRDKLTQPL